MKPENFPITIRRGSSVVKIYRETKKTGDIYYRLSFYKGGQRCGLSFTDLEEAKREANAKASQLSRGDLDALQITGKDRLVYGRALEAIRPLNVPLDAAALEFAEAKKILASFSLTEAARFYMRHYGHGIKPKPIPEAIADMIAAKKDQGLSATYLADLKYRLGLLEKTFHCNVNAIVPDDLRAFFDNLPLLSRGFNNTLATFQTFFTYAQDRGWLSKEANLLAGIEKRKEKASPVEIFYPPEMAELLANSSDELIPCLALAAFAGLRSEEILRLEWSDIERRPGFVEIAAHKAKTSARRLVPLQSNLTQWLAGSVHKSERVWPHSKPWYFEALRNTVDTINAKRQKESRKAPKFKWRQNGLRHSYISYRLALKKDVNLVSLEAGNSPQMIFRHYRELCTPADAETWFSLAPKEAKNIVPMVAA